MKWGHFREIDESERLLYTVLTWIIAQSWPIDELLNPILSDGGGLGGDPGWKIKHLATGQDSDHFSVWADPEMSGILPAEKNYSSHDFREAVKECLLAFGEAYPDRGKEVASALQRHQF